MHLPTLPSLVYPGNPRRDRWLHCPSHPIAPAALHTHLSQQIHQLEQQLAADPHPHPTILLAESDPLRQIAGLLTALHHHCPLILANPHWGDHEWHQALRQIQPHLLLTPPLSQSALRTPYSALRTPPLPHSVLIPTGGTSGQIRFVQHTWDSLMASVRGFQQHFGVDRIHSYCLLPLYHVSGLMQFLRSYSTGGQLVIQPFKSLSPATLATQPDPSDLFVSLVPTQLQRLLQSPELTAWLSQCKAVLLGGAPAWPHLVQQAQAAGIPLAPTYGMTETASQVATLKPAEFRQGRTGSGRVLPHAAIAILSPTGDRLPANQVGQVTVQAESLAWGYYPDLPFAGQFITDDLGYLDADGYLHIVGRSSHKIITGGENVFPEEVEAIARTVPGLAERLLDICVVGVPDDDWGEAVTALVVTEGLLREADLKAAIAPHLSRYKQPKHWLAVPHLPRNAQGKINRKLAQEMAIAALHCHHGTNRTAKSPIQQKQS